MDYLTYKVLPDGVIRGIISLLQKEVKPENISTLSGRIKRHSDCIYAILKTMMKIEPEIADNMASGFADLDKYLLKKQEEKTIDFVLERK